MDLPEQLEAKSSLIGQEGRWGSSFCVSARCEIHRIKLTAVSLANTVDVRRWRSVHDGDTVTEACLQTTSSSSEGKLEPRSDGELENRWGLSHLVNLLILW